MSLRQQVPGSLASLSEREIEVLRLLAAGHTVKSISARLNRTEASINERLRDARRKTGVGSSRELARLLDGQKIWDRNFDLPPQDCAPNSPEQPQGKGPNWLKGRTIMLFAIPLAAAGLFLAAKPMGDASPLQLKPQSPRESSAPASARSSPLVGTWSLDVARIPESERPRKVTIGFRLSPDRKWTMIVDIVAPDGSTQHAESTAAGDGLPVPIRGNMAFIDTAALRQPAPGTLVATLAKGDVPVSTRIYTASKDRKSMTETIIWAGNHMPGLETTHFSRID